jgi:hypothetical protein
MGERRENREVKKGKGEGGWDVGVGIGGIGGIVRG